MSAEPGGRGEREDVAGSAGEQDAPGPPSADPTLTGPDLARAALAQAKARAQARGMTPRTARPRRAEQRPGSGSDARDPVLFGAAIQRMLAERGWEAPSTAARVLGEWDRLVGPEIADHCQPVSLVDGELVLVAESSAWATQLRLLQTTLLSRLAGQVGSGVVSRLVVRGPAQPDWRRGPRRVQGRGPRDTYG